MGKKAKVRTYTLRYDGLFNYQGFYDMIVGWFIQRKYDYIETLWKEKEATPEGHEISVKMAPERKVTEYIKFRMKGNWLSIDVHPVMVTQHGRQVKLTSARFSFKLDGEVEYDWQGLSKQHQKLGKLFDEKVIDKEVLYEYRPQLRNEMKELLEKMKEFLHMESTKLEKEVRA